MTIALPRRQKAPAKTGPRLDIAPWEIREHMSRPHGLSDLLREAPSWARFVWRGQELSSPLKALYIAESLGLLTGAEVAIADITTEANDYRADKGLELVSDLTVATSLRQVALYLQAALGVTLHPSPSLMTVRLIDTFDHPDVVARYINQLGQRQKDLEQQQQELEQAIAAGEVG